MYLFKVYGCSGVVISHTISPESFHGETVCVWLQATDVEGMAVVVVME